MNKPIHKDPVFGSLARAGRVLWVVLAILLAIALLQWLGLLHALLILFFGLLFGVMLSALADLVARWTKLSRGWSLAVVVVVLCAVVGLGFYFLVPRIVGPVVQLAHRLPDSVQKIRASLEKHAWARPLLGAWSSPGGGAAGNVLGRLTGLAQGGFQAAVDVVVIVFLGLYLAGSGEKSLEGVLRLFQENRRDHAREVFLETGQTLRLWMKGQLVPMAVIGTLTAVGLWIIGVPMAITIGVLAGLVNFIPNFGPLMALVPALLLALAQDPSKAMWVIVLWIVAQSLEGYVVTPLVQKRMVDLPPALTISMQVILGLLAGGLGVALAAPLAAAGLVMLKMLYIEDTLGEKAQLPGEKD